MTGQKRESVVVDVGCGPRGIDRLPRYFDSWRQVRVDVDPGADPDIVADITNLSPLADGSVDAIWASHCVEHLFAHQVPDALSEFRRILSSEGFACVIVPDLQTIGSFLVADRMHESVYLSQAGPVTAHDMVFGFGPSVAQGHLSMAHKCGFTPSLLSNAFVKHSFGEVLIRRRSQAMELAALARVTPAGDEEQRLALASALGL